jgi:aminoglycoside/choline kinase family phosphotransferase
MNPTQPNGEAPSGAIAQLARKALGAEIQELEPLPPGLGARRFYRVHLSGVGPARLIARVEAAEDAGLRPAGVAPEPPLEPLRSFLEEAGVPVPRSFGRDPERGIELLEDAGPRSLEQLAQALDAPERRSLYAEACALLPRLQALSAEPDRIPAFGRHLDAALFAYKAEQLIQWGLPWALGRAASAAEGRVVREAFDLIAEESAAAPQRLAHRDYKAANLHVRPGAPEGRRLVLIDLQGAFLAPPEYDLVCLLCDAHVGLPEAEVEDHLAKIRPALPDAPEAECFQRRFHLLTLTRNGKDLARYLYAARNRGDRRYLSLLPTSVRILRRAGARSAPWDPRLARLADLFGRFPESSCAP